MTTRGLRNAAIFTFILSMGILLLGGSFAVDQVPPIPEKVVAAQAELTNRATVVRGQEVYQRYGLMDHGSVWGHGSLRGMDFSAHTLHMLGQLMRISRPRGASRSRAPTAPSPTRASARSTPRSSTSCASTGTTPARRPST